MSSSHKTQVFVSFSDSDQGLAEKLIAELQARGIEARSRAENESSKSQRPSIDTMVKSADGVIFLLGAKSNPSSHQGREWSAALGAKWEDSSKHLIPVLLGKTEIPSFLAGYDALKLGHRPQDLSSTADDVVRLLARKPARSSIRSNAEAAKRKERLRYVERAAKLLRN